MYVFKACQHSSHLNIDKTIHHIVLHKCLFMKLKNCKFKVFYNILNMLTGRKAGIIEVIREGTYTY